MVLEFYMSVLMNFIDIYSFIIINNMKYNKNRQKKEPIRKTISPFVWHKSIGIAKFALEMLLEIVNLDILRIEEQKRQCNNLISFAKIHEQRYFYSYLNQMLPDEPTKTHLNDDKQPSNIEVDKLAIACLDKTTQKSIRSVLNKTTKLTDSKFNFFQTERSLSQRSLSVKLPLETIQQTNIIMQLRQKKLNDEINKKQQSQQRKKQLGKRSIEQSSSNLIINFDYNGSVLDRKTREQGNLVLKVIEEKLKNQKIVKKVGQISQFSEVSPILKPTHIKRSKSKVIEEEFSQFHDTKSLAESIDINRGVRYSHNSLVFEEKKHTLSIIQLKSQLGNRKISKKDYSRIMQSGQQIIRKQQRKLKTEQLKEVSFSHKRSLSQANIKRSRFRNRDVISVLNPELKSSMLIRLQQYEPFLVIQKEFPEDTSILQDKNQLDQAKNQSEISQKQLDSLCHIEESEKMTPKLPPIVKRQPTPKASIDDLIITKLQLELQNKLRI